MKINGTIRLYWSLLIKKCESGNSTKNDSSETEIYLLIHNKENYEKLYHNKLSVQFSQFKIMI